MRYFSFKILILCILLPPLLYILTIRFFEDYLQTRYTRELENTYLGDTRPLLEGAVRLKEAVNENVDRFFKSKPLTEYGLIVRVTVTTQEGTIIYPAVFEQESEGLAPSTPMEIAAQNFELLNEGLVLDLEVRFEQFTSFPTLILAAYIALAVLFLYVHYKRASGRIAQDESKRQQEIRRLLEQQQETAGRLETLNRNRETLNTELQRLKNDLSDEKTRASRNEDELIEEIDILEKKLEENLNLQLEQQSEIESLKEQIQEYEKDLQRDEKKRTKESQAIEKRFNTLYKNLTVRDRALNGLIELNDDLRIKAEEVIHQLNANPDQVTIKRKVFIGKRDKKSIMEVIFGYKGRLYFWKRDGAVEVLAIGTKNTQSREMEYLNNL
jgi:hypothetical protein